MGVKLEEVLLSIRLDWDFLMFVKEIVDKVCEQDLSLIFFLEGKCKNYLFLIVFKLVQGLKILVVVVLLLYGGRMIFNLVLKKEIFKINDFIKKFDGGVGLIGKKVDIMVNVIYK